MTCLPTNEDERTRLVDVLHGFSSIIVQNAVLYRTPLSIESLIFQELLTLTLKLLQPHSNRLELQE